MENMKTDSKIYVELQYGVTYGRGDSSDWIDWETEISGKEKEAYLKAKLLHLSFDDFPELESVLDAAREEIKETEIENAIEYDDEYALECLGRIPVDENEMTELVHARDPRALEYFGLEDADDEEIEEWDAESEIMPDICDFYDDFEETDPFEDGWDLSVAFAETPEEAEVEEEDAAAAIEYLLSEGNIEGLADYINRVEGYYYSDTSLNELAKEIAAKMGIELQLEE